MEHTLSFKIVKIGSKLVKLVARIPRDMPFVLGRLNRSHIHNSFNQTGSSIITRDIRIEDQLELIQERNEHSSLRGQQTDRVYVHGLNRRRGRSSKLWRQLSGLG